MNPKTKKKMQQFFTKAVNGLAMQGWRQGSNLPNSYTQSTCQLRGAQGTKCFLGQLLTDAQAKRVEEDVDTAIELLAPKSKTLRSFLNLGRQAHDWAASRADMQARMRLLASDYKLKLPKCLREVKP